MPVNTQNKRRSVQAYTLGAMRPVPDGVIDAADRATITWLYSGVAYPPTPPTPPSGGDDYIMFCRHKGRR